MYPILLVVIAQTVSVFAVSKSGEREDAFLLWVWVVTNLLCSASIYSPVLKGKSGLFVLYYCFAVLAAVTLVLEIFIGTEEWLSLEPYISLLCVSFAIDYNSVA